MKKFFKILGGLILLLLLVIILLPILFKGKILDLVLDQANQNLNAKVELKDLNLSLFENFPDFTVTIEGIKVDGVEQFEGVTLASIGEIKASVDLSSVISGEQIQVNTVGISNLDAHVIVTKDGKANWDIAKASEETAEETPEEPAAEESGESAPFKLQVKEYYLRNFNVIYDDRQGEMRADVKEFTHEGKGDFTQSNFLLETKTTIAALDFVMEGMKYAKALKADMTLNLDIDQENAKYGFRDNEIKLNDLTLQLDGWLQMLEDKMSMDISFKALETSFKNLLSLVPNAYTADFANIKTAGSLALDAEAKGDFISTDESMSLPAFNANLVVNNAMFQYPDLPEKAENINIDVHVKNSGGDVDNTLVDVNKFHVEMAKNPVDLRVHLAHLTSDPEFEGALTAQIDLGSLGSVIPMEEGDKYEGNITSNIEFAGKQSYIDTEEYDKVKAEGELIILGVNYATASLNYPVQLKKMYMKFSPKQVNLTQFDAMVGKSDIQADGEIDNIFAYVFKEEAIKGTFNLRSSLMDINELMGPEEETTEEATSTEAESDTAKAEPMEVVEVPSNIDFVLTTDIKKLIYDNIDVTNVYGLVTVRDSKLSMDKLKMNLMDGGLVLSGAYETIDLSSPSYDFTMDVQKWDVKKVAETFNTVEKLAPIVKGTTGKLSTDLVLEGKLDNKMEPVMESIFGKGTLRTHNVSVDSENLKKVDKVIKGSEFSPLKLNNVDISYEIKDGKVTTKPFDIKTKNSTTTIAGFTTLEGQMDYDLDMKLPTSALGKQASAFANNILGEINKAGISTGNLGKEIKVSVRVYGDITNPKVKPNFASSGNKASIKEEVKELVKENIDKAKEEAKKKAREEADKILADAKKEADKLVEEARKLGVKLKAEAKNGGDQLRVEADKQAKKLVDDASNPFAKVAAETAGKQLKKQADKQAIKLEEQADKKAKQLEATAQEKADKILEAAKKKAEERLK